MPAGDWRPGDVLTADALNELYRRTEPRAPRVSGSLSSRVGPDGNVQIAASIRGMGVGVANGTINARRGTTPGTGTVTVQEFDGTSLSTGLDVTVFNFSSASGGIASGKYCWICQDDYGYWWVVSAEC